MMIAGLSSEASLLPMFWYDISIVALCVVHIFACTLLSITLYFWNLEERSFEHPLAFYGLLLMITFPVFGLLALSLLFVTAGWFREKMVMGSYNDYKEHITKKGINIDVSKGHIEGLRDIRSEISFDSFIDVIKGEDSKKKSQVVNKLSEDVSKENISLLKEALNDASQDVRFYAADALMKVEGNINNEIAVAEHMAQHRGGSYAAGAMIKLEDKIGNEIAIAKMMTQRRGMMKDFLRLGDIYQDYAFSGLLEKNSQKHYFSLSCEEYQKALDIETGQPKVMLRYIHSLLQLGEHKHSQKMLKQLSKIWKTNNDIHFLSASMAFYLNKFGDIKKHLEKIVLEDLDDEKIETVKFWLQKT